MNDLVARRYVENRVAGVKFKILNRDIVVQYVVGIAFYII